MPTLAATQGSGAAAGGATTSKQRRQQHTEQLKAVQQAVRAANEEPDLLKDHFPEAFASFSKAGLGATLSFASGPALSAERRDAVWALFEGNMAAVYKADGQKWSPKAKRRELFHEDARYFLATGAGGELLGFTHFRFEVEDNDLDGHELEANRLARYDPVLYCYELQVAPAAQKKGLGRRLMQMLELLALKFKASAVMLTVQQSNAAARAFYAGAGYKQHPSCPERNGFADFGDQDPGHRILWKDLRRQ